MSQNTTSGEWPKVSFERRFGKASGTIGIASLPLSLLTLGIQVEIWVRIVLAMLSVGGILIYLYSERRPLQRLFRRLDAMINGASRLDLTVDLLRIFGFLLIASAPIAQYGSKLLEVNGGKTFVGGVMLILVHPVYRFFRKPSMWDVEFKLRKTMVAAAISCASAALEEEDNERNINRIEINALLAIKSYLEYSVTDRSKTKFSANLLVKDPVDESKWVCIQRSNAYKPVPKRYNKEDMEDATIAFNTRKPRYISDNRNLKNKLSEKRDYRMVWLIPIRDHDEGEKIIGLLGIDSEKAGHLDLEDNRESLLFNLLPFIALLRFTLTLRRLENVWP
jgi:hypothetical protein